MFHTTKVNCEFCLEVLGVINKGPCNKQLQGTQTNCLKQENNTYGIHKIVI